MGGPCVVVLHGAIGILAHLGERAFEGELGAEGLPQYLQHPSGANVPVEAVPGALLALRADIANGWREEALARYVS